MTKRSSSATENAASQVMKTAHYTWLSGDAVRDGKTVRIGKKNLMNNFCISVTGNWASCTRCHAGYGWTDATYTFDKQENVDCLVCHDGSGAYTKDKGGLPGPKVNLAKVAGSVRAPRRENCGTCHFNGGGGMGVKHGDLDDSLLNASEEVDVHMGRLDFQCVDCHKSHEHLVPGKSTPRTRSRRRRRASTVATATRTRPTRTRSSTSTSRASPASRATSRRSPGNTHQDGVGLVAGG